MLIVSVAIVESSEPESANVGSKCPLTNPDGILEVLDARSSQDFSINVTIVTNIWLSFPPSHVLMRVNDNVFLVIIGE